MASSQTLSDNPDVGSDVFSLDDFRSSLPNSSMATSMKPCLTEFSLFSNLPLEIRSKIWRMSIVDLVSRTIGIESKESSTIVNDVAIVQSRIEVFRYSPCRECLPNVVLTCKEALEETGYCFLQITGTDQLMIFHPVNDILALHTLDKPFLIGDLVDQRILARVRHVDFQGVWMDNGLREVAVANLQCFTSMNSFSILGRGIIGPEHRAPPNINYNLENHQRPGGYGDSSAYDGFPHFVVTWNGYMQRCASALQVLLDRVTDEEERHRIVHTALLVWEAVKQVPNIPDTVFVRIDYMVYDEEIVEPRELEPGTNQYKTKWVPRSQDLEWDDISDGLVSPFDSFQK